MMTYRRAFRRAERVALSVSIALLLAACGGGAAAPAAPTAAPTSAPTAATTAAGAPAAAPTTKPVAPAAATSNPAAPAAAASPTAGSAAAQPPDATKNLTLKVRWGGATATVAPLWMADAIGAFQKRGLAVDMGSIASSAVAAALVNKEVDVWASSAAGMITADLNGGLDLAYTSAIQNSQTASLYVAQGITTPDGLKGKKISSDKPGTPNDFFVHRLLTKAGVKASDVQILPLGGSEVGIPAFLAGQVDAIGTVPPYTFQLDSKGYKQLVSIVGEPYVGMGFISPHSRLDELAPQLRAFTAAMREGVTAYNEQPELAKQVIAKYTKETDPDVLQKTYDFYRTSAPFDPSLKAKDESFQYMLDYLAETLLPAAKDAKPSQFYDWRFVDELPKS